MAKGTILKIVCMDCQAGMGEKDGKGITGISHGICPDCWSKRFPGVPYPDHPRDSLLCGRASK